MRKLLTSKWSSLTIKITNHRRVKLYSIKTTCTNLNKLLMINSHINRLKIVLSSLNCKNPPEGREHLVQPRQQGWYLIIKGLKRRVIRTLSSCSRGPLIIKILKICQSTITSRVLSQGNKWESIRRLNNLKD
jgi:hypothetical protein